MGSRPALIRQRDVKRIVKGYADAGVVVEMKVENGVARFIPVDTSRPANEPSPKPDAEDAYRQWKERHAG